jgi:hypothetical protein
MNDHKCFMCGNRATKRMSPDMDIYGIPLCIDSDCSQLLAFALLSDEEEDKIEATITRFRKLRHKQANNIWKP